MKAILSMILAVAVMAPLGCAVRPNTTPPSAAQAAAIGLDDFQALASAAQDSEIAIYKSGLIDKPTHLAIQKAFNQVGLDIVAAGAAMRTGISKDAVSVRIQTIRDEINGDLTSGVLGVKDPVSQAKLKALVTALANAASTLTH